MMTPSQSGDDNMILADLEQFQPTPSQRFYHKMAAMPWMTPARPPVRRMRWVWGLGFVLATLFLVAAFAISQPGYVVAEAVMHWFTPQSSDIATKEKLGIPDSVSDWLNDLSLADVEQLNGGGVWQPTSLPQGYQRTHLSYLPSEHVVMSVFEYTDAPNSSFRFDQLPTFVLVQQLREIADRGPASTIGASAALETVTLGDTTGEYVEGAWTASSSEAAELEWETLPCCRTLRWQRGEVVLTLQAHNYPGSPGFLSRDAMIDLAAQIAQTD